MAGKLTELAQQRARLEAKAAELRAREKTLSRQAATRRKVVAGAIVLRAATEGDERARAWLVAQLKKAVAARDLHLFADLFGDGGEA